MGDVDVAAQLAAMQASQDTLWVIVSGIGILGLQAGFTMLEAGTAKAKNVKAILTKNMLDFCFGIIAWYLVGWGLYQGDGAILPGAPSSFVVQDETQFASFVQQFGFAITGATILSGSVLGRMRLELYLLVAVLYTGAVYPILAHWAWSTNGFLGALGFRDYAGSGVVHMTGGIFGLVGAWLCGPRVGRFVETSFGSSETIVRRLPPHAPSLQVLGVMLLAISWMYFNAGSTAGTDTAGILSASRALINSLLAMGASGMVVSSVLYARFKIHFLDATGNGLLAGLVAITGPCGYVDTWAACLIGATAGLLYMFTAWLVLEKLRIDDALDAFAVHGACGAWGVIAVGIFDRETGLVHEGDVDQLLAQLAGLGVLVGVSLLTALAIMFLLKRTTGLALDEDDQLLGLDVKYHEGYAYPEFGAADVAEYNATREAAQRRMGRANTFSSGQGTEGSEGTEGTSMLNLLQFSRRKMKSHRNFESEPQQNSV